MQPFSSADEEYPEGPTDEDDEDETEYDYTSRVRGSEDVAMPDDDDDLDADEPILPLECPPGYAFARSASPALDASLVKRHIMLCRALGYVKGFIMRRAHARTRQDYDYRVLIDRTDAALSMRLPRGKYTAVGEAAAEGSWVLLEEATELSRMLQRELLAPPQGGGNRYIDRDGSTDRGKEDNDERESGHEEGTKEGPAGGTDGDSKASGLKVKEDSSSGSENGDGAGANQEGQRREGEWPRGRDKRGAGWRN